MTWQLSGPTWCAKFRGATLQREIAADVSFLAIGACHGREEILQFEGSLSTMFTELNCLHAMPQETFET